MAAILGFGFWVAATWMRTDPWPVPDIGVRMVIQLGGADTAQLQDPDEEISKLNSPELGKSGVTIGLPTATSEPQGPLACITWSDFPPIVIAPVRGLVEGFGATAKPT